MKRYIAMLLIFILMSSSAIAEEILFRDIPWGISVEEFEQNLLVQGIEFTRDLTYDNEFKIDTWSSFYGIDPWWVYQNVPQRRIRYEAPDDDYICSVGGYMVANLYAEYLYAYDTENEVVYNDTSSLVRASYQFYGKKENGKYSDDYDCYQDFVYKLTLLYGEPTGKETGSFGTSATYWKGQNGTAVAVSWHSIGGSGWVMIDYAWTLEEEHVKGVDEMITALLERQKEKERAANLEGL